MQPLDDIHAELLGTLKRYWGYDSFRPVQEEIIRSVCQGRDTLALMPTGGGKSLTYQVPTMLREGLCIVVTPLIALMKDQVDRLRRLGINAAAIHSGLSMRQIDIVLDNCVYGDVKFLYVAPERLVTEAFRLRVERMRVSLLAVDEAHCISQWGYDFRPSYLRIAELRERLPEVPVLALTASATPAVARDIMRQLRFAEPHVLRSSFARPNLSYAVRHDEDKNEQLLRVVRNVAGSGIVYVRTRDGCEQLTEFLRDAGVAATCYHGGLANAERSIRQEEWLAGRTRIMVATNAFGMGIDKADVRFVVHYSMPDSLESYYQEAGRAGRDGERAECILLFSLGDVQTAKYFIQNSHDNDELTPEQAEAAARRDRERLDVMVGYCKTTRCLRSYLLDYFGEHHTGGCGNCSNCTGEFVQTDITTEAQKILSGVARIQKRWPGGLGIVALVQMLRGAKDQKTLERGLDQFPTYGIMRDVPPQRMRLYLDALQEQGYLAETGDEFPVITLTAKAPAVLFHGEQVTMQERTATAQETQAKRRASRKKTAARTALSEADDSLLASLKTLRSELAQKNHVPAYIVFNNVSLDEMAELKPRTMGDFRRISGVGDAKAAKYGEAFIKHIAKWVREHSEEE